MTREELLEAIGRVDDDLIQEAEDYRLPARRLGWTHWRPLAGGLAACLVLAAVLYLPFGMSGGGDNTTLRRGGKFVRRPGQRLRLVERKRRGAAREPLCRRRELWRLLLPGGGARPRTCCAPPRGSIPSPARWPPPCRRAADSWACSSWRGRTARRGCTPPAGSTPAACCGRGRTGPSM